jgi:hypothetical protein
MLIAELIEVYVRFFERLLRAIVVKFQDVKYESELRERAESTYDETLSKIELTKQHLTDAILHIDTMKNDIVQKKGQLDEVIDRIQVRETEKEQLEEEFEVSQRIRDEDAERLRTLLGVADLKESRTGKVAGFIAGVVASLIAAAIFALIGYLISYFGKSDA